MLFGKGLKRCEVAPHGRDSSIVRAVDCVSAEREAWLRREPAAEDVRKVFAGGCFHIKRGDAPGSYGSLRGSAEVAVCALDASDGTDLIRRESSVDMNVRTVSNVGMWIFQQKPFRRACGRNAQQVRVRLAEECPVIAGCALKKGRKSTGKADWITQ